MLSFFVPPVFLMPQLGGEAGFWPFFYFPGKIRQNWRKSFLEEGRNCIFFSAVLN
jgi:hypothetical protein